MAEFGSKSHSTGYLYRGTSVGWPGNISLQRIRRTPVTTDPLVATLFALECRRHGSGVVHIASQSRLAGLIVPANVLAEVECEIGVNCTPLEFSGSYSEFRVTVELACEILNEMTIDVPQFIANHDRLQTHLEDLIEGRRGTTYLTPEQIERFNQLALSRS